VLLAGAAWQAASRSSDFARILWFSFTLVAVLWSLSMGIGGLTLVLHGLDAAMARFWTTTIIFYLVGIVLTVPLLWSEDRAKPGVDWVRTFDIAQLAIVTFCAYLVLFYIPVVTNPLERSRVQQFMVAHWLRDGFLAIGFLYRAWRSPTPPLRRLLFGLSIFFVLFGGTASFHIYYYENLRPWQIPLLDFIAVLPVLFLVILATTWEQPAVADVADRDSRSIKSLLWAQTVPVLLPVSVIAIAAQISSQYIRLAWSAVAASLVCYAGRLMIMQHRQEVAQSALRSVEEKFYKAFKVSPVALAVSRLADGRIIEVNDRWAEMFKLSPIEAIGKTSIELGLWNDLDERKRFADEILKKGWARDIPLNIRIGGITASVLASGELIKLGREPVIISSLLDVTELRNATEQLRQAQKMELVGTLAAGVAHDFNNLLTIVKGYAEVARNGDLNPEVATAVGQISSAADKAAGLTRQLLAFSRRQILQPRNVNINAIVHGIEPMLRRMVDATTELVLALDPDIGTVNVDPTQMEQVLMNLVANARDAMPNGGKLRLDTRNLDLQSPYVERAFEIPGGCYVVLAVTDTGTGITPEHIDRVFEPFFTTKEIGQGTGLGLSTVYGIVKQSGGHVWAYSEEGVGTTFKIYLPRVDAPAEALVAETPAIHVLGGSETILLVEDDPGVRELAAAILGHHGYRMFTAASGEEGLRLGKEHGDEIDLLLTDVVMANGSGRELAAQLKSERADLKVIFMSGYPYFPSSGTETMTFHETFLAKPFSPSELAGMVRRTLDHVVQ
jgi:PAS domain S-box-containing protein